jgi:hypothetical protein
LPVLNVGLANIPAVGGLTATVQHDASLTLVHPSARPNLNLVIGDLVVAEVEIAALGYEAIYWTRRTSPMSLSL